MLHPIFVHFPIALLTLYSAFELLRFKKLLAWSPWWYIKASFCIAGTVIGYATITTGLIDASKFDGGRLEEMHYRAAVITMIFFTLVSIAQITRWLELAGKCSSQNIFCRLARVWAGFVFKTPVMFLVGLIGLAAITVTGALGGAMAYGSEADPVVKIIYTIFVGE